jgi:hypothetical protein
MYIHDLALINRYTHDLALINSYTHDLALINRYTYELALINRYTYELALINRYTHELVLNYVIKFAAELCFSPGTPISPTNKTDRHDVTEILVKVALNTIIHTR